MEGTFQDFLFQVNIERHTLKHVFNLVGDIELA
jgi:hypothetical protein